MSQVIATSSSSSGTKKRKHGATDHTRRDESGVASTSRDAEEPSAKRSKKGKKAAHAEGVSAAIASMAAVNLAEKKKDKKKNKHKSSREGAGGVESEFHVVSASVRLSIPPIFAPDLPAGARELLDSMLMRYVFPSCLFPHTRDPVKKLIELAKTIGIFRRCKACSSRTTVYGSSTTKPGSKTSVRSRSVE